MSSKIKYKSKFLDEWHEKAEFKDWLKKVPNDPSAALCCYSERSGDRSSFFSNKKSES